MDYFHQDQLGSTRALTDSAGATAASYTFDAYGNLTSAPPTLTNPFQFAGQYADSESGLQYMRARYYEPATGLFLSLDPLPNTRQAYQYAGDGPTNRSDPGGDCPWCIGAVVGALVGGGVEVLHQATSGDHKLHLGPILAATAVGALAGATGVGVGSVLLKAGYTFAQAGLISGFASGAVGGSLGSWSSQLMSPGHTVDLRKVGAAGALGGLFGALGGAVFGEFAGSVYGSISGRLGRLATGEWSPAFSSPVDAATGLATNAVNDQTETNLDALHPACQR